MTTIEITNVVSAIAEGVLGFGVLFILLRQSKILKTQVDTQNGIITNMKAYTDIIDINKLKQYVEISEQLVKGQMEKNISDLEEKYGKEKAEHEGTRSVMQMQYLKLLFGFLTTSCGFTNKTNDLMKGIS